MKIQPLSGLDATFLYAETPSTPMNVIATLIIDGRVDFEAVAGRVEARLASLPPFRRRLADTPFGLGHPVWVEDSHFDVREHLTRVSAPPPGDARALESVVARLARRRLDRARPLWEVTVVEGLAEDRTALVVKAHHAAVDGVSGASILLHLFDRADDATSETQVHETPPEPSAALLLRNGLARLRDRPGAYVRAAQRVGRAAADLSRTWLASDTPRDAAWPFEAPDSPFNGPLSSRRSVAYARAPLASAQHVRAVFGGTLNDVVLTACTRALQGELVLRRAPVDAPLVAAIPVSTRGRDDAADCGNRVSAFFAKLPVHVEDPVHQLGEVRRSTRHAKRLHALLGDHTFASLAELASPGVAAKAFELYGRWRLAAHHRPFVNLLLSNLPGPPVPLAFHGHPVRALHPHGPLMEGVGLNVTVMSYAGSIDIGVLACPERVPEAHRIADRVGEAMEELSKLAAAALPDVPPLARNVA